MFGPVIDTAIGLVLVYLAFSLMVTTVNEVVATILKSRAAVLRDSIANLLDNGQPGAQVTQAFYNSAMIRSLSPASAAQPASGDLPAAALPIQIPKAIFFHALRDALLQLSKDGATMQGDATALSNLKASIAALPPGCAHLQRVLNTLLDDGVTTLEQAQRRIEAWYDAAADHMTAWYKRHMQQVTFAVALLLAGLFNINSFTVVERLWTDDAVRSALSGYATTALPQTPAPSIASQTTAAQTALNGGTDFNTLLAQAQSQFGLLQSLQSLSLPVGWGVVQTVQTASGPASAPLADLLLPGTPATGGAWTKLALFSLAGWLVTAMAAMLGAPFWYNALRTALSIRGGSAAAAAAATAPAVAVDALPPAPQPAPAAPAAPAFAVAPAAVPPLNAPGLAVADGSQPAAPAGTGGQS